MDSHAHTTMIRRLLRPLVGYLISKGWGYIALRDLLKECYVAEAVRANDDGSEQGATDSLISLVTGIHRGEVKRLRALAAAAERDPADRLAKTGATRAARVVSAWLADPRFHDDGGEPALLPLHAPAGAQGWVPCIDTLLQAARIDIRGRTVVDEMLRSNTAELVDGKYVKLLTTAYISTDPAETLYFMGVNVSDHMRAAFYNLKGGKPKFIERALFHNSIPAERLDEIRGEIAASADQMLRKANQKLLDAPQGPDAASGAGGAAGARPNRRLRLGVYYFEADEADEP